MTFKQDKGGFLLGEFTLKVIVAVLCLSLLVYLLFAIYSSFMGKEELKKADSTLKKIIETAEALKEGKTENLILIEPKFTLKFSKTPLFSVDPCASNCLCLDTAAGEDRFVCRHIDNDVALENEVRIKEVGSPITISIKKEGGKYVIKKI